MHDHEKTLRALEKSQSLREPPDEQASESASAMEASLFGPAGAVTVLVTAMNELRKVLQEYHQADKASAAGRGQNRAGQEERLRQRNPVETAVPEAVKAAAHARPAGDQPDRNLQAGRDRLDPASVEDAPADHAANELPEAPLSPDGPPIAVGAPRARTMPDGIHAEKEPRRTEPAAWPHSPFGADKDDDEAGDAAEAASQKTRINRHRRAEMPAEIEAASQVQSGQDEGAREAALLAATTARMNATMRELLARTHASQQETTGILRQIVGGHGQLAGVIKSLESELREQQRQLDQVRQNLNNAGTVIGASI